MLLGRRKVVVGEYEVRDGAIKNPACGGAFRFICLKLDL